MSNQIQFVTPHAHLRVSTRVSLLCAAVDETLVVWSRLQFSAKLQFHRNPSHLCLWLCATESKCVTDLCASFLEKGQRVNSDEVELSRSEKSKQKEARKSYLGITFFYFI